MVSACQHRLGDLIFHRIPTPSTTNDTVIPNEENGTKWSFRSEESNISNDFFQ